MSSACGAPAVKAAKAVPHGLHDGLGRLGAVSSQRFDQALLAELLVGGLLASVTPSL